MSVRARVGALTAVTAALAVATSVFAVLDHGTRLPAAVGGEVDALGELMFTVMVMAFASLGALIAARRPGSPIGWILCASPFALAVSGLARGWYVRGYYADPGSQPPPDLLLEPGALDDYPRVANPFGAAGRLGDTVDAVQAAGFLVLILAAVGSAAALVARFRRSRGEERQQLRWMAAAAALVVAVWLAHSLLDQVLGIQTVFILPIVLLALPGASAVAVLRYRLYDLDLVVNRALVCGALTASLAVAYLGSVLLVGLTVGQSDVATALSTLAVAALFRPARARIQAAVDHRFYRRRYDAARTLEAFSARLRAEVDLEAVGAELGAAVRDTVQPAHLTLWLPRNDFRTDGP